MLTIGIDYGISTGDLPTYVVVRKGNGTTDVLGNGLLSEFKYSDYDGLQLQIVGELGDIQRFKEQFINKNN